MKYIYYILSILLLLTVGIILKVSNLKVEISEPAIVINDRIISEKELDERIKSGSSHSREKGFLESIITREILIQEAVKQGINKEEAFRKSVENFYEQSLVKILIDRKFQSLNPIVTDELVEKYISFSGKTIEYTKFVYRKKGDIPKGNPLSSVAVKNDFENLSDSLKYSLLLLKPGDISPPEQTETGYVTYRLDSTSASSDTQPLSAVAPIKEFLVNENKRIQFDSWLEQLKSSAEIRILTHEKLQ